MTIKKTVELKRSDIIALLANKGVSVASHARVTVPCDGGASSEVGRNENQELDDQDVTLTVEWLEVIE